MKNDPIHFASLVRASAPLTPLRVIQRRNDRNRDQLRIRAIMMHDCKASGCSPVCCTYGDGG